MKNSINTQIRQWPHARRSVVHALLLAGAGILGPLPAVSADDAVSVHAAVLAAGTAETLPTDALVVRVAAVRQQFQSTADEEARLTALRLSQILDERADAGDATAALYLGYIKKDECLTFGKDLVTNNTPDMRSCLTAAISLLKRAVALGDHVAAVQLDTLRDLDDASAIAVAEGGDGTGGRRVLINPAMPSTSLSK